MNPQHWANQQERGNDFFLTITSLIVKYCPLWLIRIITFIVVCYFYLTSTQARKNIAEYQHQLKKTYPTIQLPSYSIFRQFLAFGESITDRFAVWQHKILYQHLSIDDADQLYQDMDSKVRGQILICSHLGNIEICRALVNSGHHQNFQLNILVHNRHAKAFNQALVKAGADELSLIQVEQLDAAKMLELHQRLERGEWIAIAADRIPLRGDKSQKITFLNKSAYFPQGAWLLASLLKAPTNTIFCVKENGHYRLKLRRFFPVITGSGKQRSEQIEQAMQKYSNLLAEECYKHPLYWFNFYNFWNKEYK